MGNTTGFEQLDDTLKSLIDQRGELILRKSLRAAGEVFQAAVTEAAPVRVKGSGGNAKNPAWSLPPGALKSDIHLSVGHDDQGNLRARVTPGKYTFPVARWVEYGHELYSHGKKVGEVEAHPFIRPAFEANSRAAEAAFAETFVGEIEKVVAKGKR